MKAQELRDKYLNFFKERHGHAEIRGASLIPENDPTVLFTTAGMHPLVPYLMGEKHPAGSRLVDVQKCIRTGDIDEVGDSSHLTFFEMLGNWSLGDYFKEGAIKMSFEFLTRELELPLNKLAFSCFGGDPRVPELPVDHEAADIWKSLGVPEKRIAFLQGGVLESEHNWWGPAGQSGPCGPDTEMFYWTGDEPAPEQFDPEDKRWLEIWNDVFMQYNKTIDGRYEALSQQNVDTGMGLERVLGVLNGARSPFETELFATIIQEIRMLSSNRHELGTEEAQAAERIIADHLRAATFIIGDEMGVAPSNTDQGYVLRRLIRRAIRYGRKLGIETDFAVKIARIVVKDYGDFYDELKRNQEQIFEELAKEEQQFSHTLQKGLSQLRKELEDRPSSMRDDLVFDMYATYGFPLELTMEELQSRGMIKTEEQRTALMRKFEEDLHVHQEKSKAGAEQKFAGGLADHSLESRRLHTATHLLHQALRDVLGDHVAQKGSNITRERLRFDFTHSDKMTPEQIAEVEKIVNEKIAAALPISWEEMTVESAKQKGAIGLFESKYGERVKVYTMGDDQAGTVYSREICGGPHAENTAELGSFKISKEESSSGGVRRIKAVIGG